MRRRNLASCLFVPAAVLAVLLPALRADEEAKAAGVRRALLVGCTEYPTLETLLGEDVYRRDVVLYGPANDAAMWRDLLVARLGFAPGDVTVLAGWPADDPDARPTAPNIRSHLKRLAEVSRPGDAVFLLFAGHGTRLPDLSGDEPDGRDEVFLPADVARWQPGEDGIPGAITDDEIHDALAAIRATGATISLVMDCCHSGTMMRGGTPGLRMRKLDPELLGVPPAPRTRGAPDRDGAASGDAADGGATDGVAALYAAQSYHTAPEMRLPLMSEDAEQHGLLSWLLAAQVERLGNSVTFGELYRQLVAAYRALPYYGTTPLVDGDLDLTVDGRRDPAGAGALRLHVEKIDGELVLDAGTLAGVVPGTVLAVRHPEDEAKTLGYVEVFAADLTAARVRAIVREDLSLPNLVGPTRLCPSEVVEVPMGDYALRWSVVDEQGRHLGKDVLPVPVREALQDERSKRRFPYVEDPASASWLLVFEPEQEPVLRPAATNGDAGAFRVAVDALPRTLAHIFRIENLRKVALRQEQVAGFEKGLSVDLLRVTPEGDESLGERPTVQPGDRVRIRIVNETWRRYDVWVFFVNADYGLEVAFPPRGAISMAKFSPEEQTSWESPAIPVTDAQLGEEELIVVAVPRPDDAPVTNLGWLAQASLERATHRMRGDAGRDAFGDLLEELAFGDQLGQGKARTRGLSFGDDQTMPAMRVIAFRTAYGEPTAPGFGDGAPVPVIAPRHLHEAMASDPPEPWRPQASGLRLRGDLAELYGRVAPSVVVVLTATGHGTGFLVRDEDTVITNAHVVGPGTRYSKEGRPTCRVLGGSLEDGVMVLDETAVAAEVLAVDEARDLALLRLVGEAPWRETARPIPLADGDPRPGSTCVMVGHPASGLLWSVRECRVSGVGRSPQDFSDVLLRALVAEGAGREQARRQLDAETPVRIVLSSCQANPGDSGGPLVNESGELVAVTHAIPAEVRADKFVYHIHGDEVRAFLAAARDGADGAGPVVPQPWRLGPNVVLKRTAFTPGGFDLLLAGTTDPEQILIDVDVDDETAILRVDPGRVEQIVATHAFDAEFGLHLAADRRIAFYDTDNDGTFDLVLVDEDEDPEADVRFDRAADGTWSVETDVDLPLLSTAYMSWIGEDRALRQQAVQKLRLLT